MQECLDVSDLQCLPHLLRATSYTNVGNKMHAYPIGIKASDFVLVFITVIGISAIASGISARLSIKRLGEIKEEL